MKATYKKIGIKSLDTALDEFAAVCDAVVEGKPVAPRPAEFNFTSLEAFRKALTPQRYALLRLIHEKRPGSLQELAELAGRDMKNVSEDVKKLVEMDMVEMERHGRAKSPRVNYDRIILDLAV
jgi:predicted transcriptional regulator